MTFTSIDYDKFRALRVTHVATRLEELIQDEANDTLTPEQLFLTAVDDALESRRVNKVERLIRQAQFPIPAATVAEVDYRDGRGITPVRMRRYVHYQRFLRLLLRPREPTHPRTGRGLFRAPATPRAPHSGIPYPRKCRV